MKSESVDKAISEAKRFIEKASELKLVSIGKTGYSFPKESGAAMRASMDLTRALADLRQGR